MAMGYPAENVEGMYRNSMTDVQRFFDERHPGAYKVYNLCSERSYDKQKFHGRVAHYPFQDHNAPPVELMRPFCQDVQAWVGEVNDDGESKKNVAVIHCKAGKGRTGVMICAYLLHCGMWQHADDALKFYGAARTKNAKGVTIPSQSRYVRYYEQLLATPEIPFASPPTLFLSEITLNTVPRFNNKECNPVFVVKMKNVKVFQSKALADTPTSKDQQVQLSLSKRVPVCGDVKIEFYHKNAIGSKDKMFHFWFNTAFIRDNQLMMTKLEVDKAHKDKQCKVFSQDFSVHLQFTDPDMINSSATKSTSVGITPPLTSSTFQQHVKKESNNSLNKLAIQDDEIDADDDSFANDVGEEEESEEEQ